eukprot:TRINITY_DN452_c0_g3_i1.p1 TRINITY_DN452_c0_g3~~TRINITY_DN452_c0_g3_i1.p1  ORF type:complete len:422 (-),score=100.13 TRINITY_DN452_c0_g3_i1:191-1456(-)
MLEAPSSPNPGSSNNAANAETADAGPEHSTVPPKMLAAKLRKREKDRLRAQQKRQLLQEQSDELKVLKEQFSGVSETLNIIKDIMGADNTDVATQIRTMAAIVSNARSLIEALPHNSELRRPITKWLIRSLNPSEACRIFGLSRAAYYRAYHSKEEKLMANASGYHHQHRRSFNPPDANATAAAIAAAVAMIHQPNDESGSPDECDEAPLSPNSMRASTISSLSMYQPNAAEGQAMSFPHLQQIQPLSMPMQSQSSPRQQHSHSHSQHPHPHHPHVHHGHNHGHGQIPVQHQTSPRHLHQFQSPRPAAIPPPKPQHHQQGPPPHSTLSRSPTHVQQPQSSQSQPQTQRSPSPTQPQSQPAQTQLHHESPAEGSPSHSIPEQQHTNDDNMPSLLSVVAEAGAQTLEQQQAQQQEGHKRQRTL